MKIRPGVIRDIWCPLEGILVKSYDSDKPPVLIKYFNNLSLKLKFGTGKFGLVLSHIYRVILKNRYLGKKKMFNLEQTKIHLKYRCWIPQNFPHLVTILFT